jgi:hypothetical protein
VTSVEGAMNGTERLMWLGTSAIAASVFEECIIIKSILHHIFASIVRSVEHEIVSL